MRRTGKLSVDSRMYGVVAVYEDLVSGIVCKVELHAGVFG